MQTLPPDLVAGTLETLGIEVLTQNGDELVALCPGHEARTGKKDGHPSWSINEETGTHFCFSCHYKGNLITLVRDLKGEGAASDLFVGFDNLEGRFVSEDAEDIDRITNPDKPTAGKIRTANFKPESWLDDFMVPPDWARKERRISSLACKEYEVLWDRDRKAWILPLRDPEKNRLLGYQVKSQRTRYFRNRPRSMEKSETFFGLPAVRGRKKVVVVESPLDAVLLSDMGVHAMAICGSRLSDAQIELLREFEEVFLWLDNDTAGELENKRLRKVLIASGVRTEFITPESYPDWDDQWKDAGEMPDAIIDAILTAAGV